jgi:hypothetical protein
MSEPAKDEDELVHRVADTLREYVPHINFHGEAIRAIAAIRAAGWALVPVEPTKEMLNRGHYAYDHPDYGPFGVYREMLAAAPGVKP